MNEEERAFEELKNDLMNHNTSYARSYEDKCFKAINKLEQRIDETTAKLELLINDLKLNQEEEKQTGKSYFNTQLFAIRVREILKTLKGSDK